MFRDFVCNKWVIGGIVFLIVLSVACVFWYRYDTAPYRKAAAKSAEVAREWEATQKSDTESKAVDASADSTTLTVEKSITETNGTRTNSTVSRDPKDVLVETQPSNKTDVIKVSPYGFGPYPPLPLGWRGTPEKTWNNLSANHELLKRVRIKLILQGIDVRGAVMKYGKVYPIIKGIRYVRWETENTPMGEYRYIAGSTGHPDDGDRLHAIREAKFNRGEDDDLTEADIPPDIKLVPYKEGGVNPYEFLGLTPP